MSATERDRALGALEDDPATTVMLASLGVCAVGLNLTAANQIILSDTWWYVTVRWLSDGDMI
jgi:SWI/SNF-related matrix-associated actin-dependent regulator of chromatin subfamily A3